MAALGKLGGDLLCLVVTTAYANDLRSKKRRLAHLFLGNQAGHEYPQLNSRPGTGCSISHGRISGGGDNRLTNISLGHGCHCHSSLPIFERTGWAVAFILDVCVLMTKSRS